MVHVVSVDPTETIARPADPAGHPAEMVTAPFDPAPASLHAEQFSNESVPGYTILRQIGCGGMGTVFEAVRKSNGEVVALKIITPTMEHREKTLQLFLREASVLSQLRHKRIVEFYEVGIADDRLFIAMEYVDAIDLFAYLANRTRSDQDYYCCGITCQLLEGLAYAHGRGIVHRDIKPSNTLISRSDNRLRTKLTDFGLAKVFNHAGFSGITGSDEIRGTIAFMAPEQLMDARYAKPAADIYAVGATLYHFLTGKYPYDNTEAKRPLEAILQGDLTPIESHRSDLPTGLADIVHTAMAMKPAKRFSTALKMYRALLPFARKPVE